MNKKRILSTVMAVLMVISLLPSLVFAAAAPAGKLDGKLKIKGAAAVGSTLSADFTKAQPEGLTGEYVSFQWARKTGEELTEVGTDGSYKVTEEDLGSKLVLTVTGIEDNGVSGSLSASTEAVSGASAQPEDESGDGAQEPQTDVPDEKDTQDEEQNGDTPELPDEQTEEPAQSEEPQQTEEGRDSEAEEADVPLTYTAEAGTEAENGILDFGTLDYEYEDVPEAQYASIKNTGTGELYFESVNPEHFMVQDIEEPIQPGEEVTVFVQPRMDLEPGTYLDTIIYTSDEGVTASFQAMLTVNELIQESVQEPEGEDPDMQPIDNANTVTGPGPVLKNEGENAEPAAQTPVIAADPATLAFTALTEGYTQITEVQTITVTNKGESAVTLTAPQSKYFDVAAVAADGTQTEAIVLEKDQSAAFTVQPKAGLEKGQYSDEIMFGVQGNDQVTAKVTAEVEVKAAEAEVLLKAEPSSVKFDTIKEGYTELPAAQTVTLTNPGTEKLVLKQPESENFVVGDLTKKELAAGEQATFTVQPKAGLQAGEYKDTIDIFSDEFSQVSDDNTMVPVDSKPLASITAELKVEKTELVYKLTVEPESLDFGSAEAGYGEAPAAQTVTVTNSGDKAAELGQPVSEYFEIGALSAAVLQPGEKAAFMVRPKAGLEESDYLEVIDVPNDGEMQALVNVYFSVTDKSIKLTEIQKVGDITGLKNGVDKSVNGLKLPSTVVIRTSNGKMKANVKWDVKGSSYDQSSTDKQTFNVKGTVTLPKGVKNPDEISLITSVKVTVNGYSPKVPDASENKITGIDSDGGYTTETKITFTAVGAGMDNSSPRKGDVRFVPLNWKVSESRSWDSAPYTATFRMGQSGNYTLTVVFNRQKFDGSNWVNTGEQDSRQVNFSVGQPKNVTGQNLTPAAKKSDANKRTAVKTGDTTNVAPFIIILVVAAACIVGVVFYRKKKK